MLLALLLPDPCDENCPAEFRQEARHLLDRVPGRVGSSDEDLRKALLRFTGDFASWDLSSDATYLEVSRGLVRAAHGEEPPLVVDPFAGGGSIPLEALRLGCDAFASDLNPVACLILKVMLEDIPRSGSNLAEELRRVGAEIKRRAEKELIDLYPRDPDGATPIAYLWARSVLCEQPECGAEIPLARSFWLSKKSSRRRALRFATDRRSNGRPQITPEIFCPSSDGDVPPPTARNGGAVCLACRKLLAADRVRAQLAAQHGGSNPVFEDGRRTGGALLLAVVLLRDGQAGRQYRLANDNDYTSVARALTLVQNAANEHVSPTPFPNEPLPSPSGKGYLRDGLYYNFFPLVRYGLRTWGDFFTARQNLALATFARHVGRDCREHPGLLLALGKLVDLANVVCPWEPIAECPRNVLSNGRVKPSWSFAEAVPTGGSAGSFVKCLENLCAGIEASGSGTTPAAVRQAPAQKAPLPHESAAVWFTDPPYYDAIPYGALADAFWVWIKRANNSDFLSGLAMGTDGLSPKHEEIIDDLELLRGHKKEHAIRDGIPAKDRSFFENQMTLAFSQGSLVLREGGIGCVVFAHQTTEGWEALLGGMIRTGLVITGSWPIATEMAHRLRARESAALGTSVHLICRPRPDDAEIGDWAEVLRELPERVGDWMERLQGEGVRGADLVFACIGPALEIYSRYSKVVDAEDRPIPLGGDPEATDPYKRGYLAYVWEVVGRTALAQVLGTAERRARNGAATALEEDARLTALFLWTLQSTNGVREDKVTDDPDEGSDADEDDEGKPAKKKPGLSLVYDVVRRFAQPLGIHLQDWEDRIIEKDKGVVRLLPVAERAKQLFGDDGADAMADHLESNPTATPQLALFPDADSARPKVRGRGRRRSGNAPDAAFETRREATTLDRVHAAMLLQRAGRANALRALLSAEQDRGPDFLRLANALSALYPKESEEKRLLDAMLLAAPR
jgi:adenine-specific DNA methylase